jgi:Na+/melibiose symporter-like transporter
MLVVAFFESFSTILIERGIYFFTCHALGFGDRANLLLALAFGLVYAAAAAGSHRLTRRFGEKALLVFTLAAQFFVTLAIWRGRSPCRWRWPPPAR